jgi:hypothetical protein
MWLGKRIAAFVALAAFTYLGWYYVLVGSDGLGQPRYGVGDGFFGDVLRSAFRPWHRIDRELRPDAFLDIRFCCCCADGVPDDDPRLPEDDVAK